MNQTAALENASLCRLHHLRGRTTRNPLSKQARTNTRTKSARIRRALLQYASGGCSLNYARAARRLLLDRAVTVCFVQMAPGLNELSKQLVPRSNRKGRELHFLTSCLIRLFRSNRGCFKCLDKRFTPGIDKRIYVLRK